MPDFFGLPIAASKMVNIHRRVVMQHFASITSVGSQVSRLIACLTLLVGCVSEPAINSELADSAGPAHEVEIHQPASLRGLPGPETDVHGRPVAIPCMTCHGVREEAHQLPADASELGLPHSGLELKHGGLPCASCHSPERADQLRLADDTRIPLTEAMRLCSQCHGPQRRDYDHGAHGGMRGHWDLQAGARVRNHCVDCHNPHAPAFPQVQPMPGPRDRFLTKKETASHE